MAPRYLSFILTDFESALSAALRAPKQALPLGALGILKSFYPSLSLLVPLLFVQTIFTNILVVFNGIDFASRTHRLAQGTEFGVFPEHLDSTLVAEILFELPVTQGLAQLLIKARVVARRAVAKLSIYIAIA